MEIAKNYMRCKGSDAAMILILGSGGSTPLTKGVAKWLVKQGISVLPMNSEKGIVGYHSFPLERIEGAIAALKAYGNKKIGILGASITTIPALTAAARFPEITMTIVFSPCDFVLQGFTQGRRDGCREWPLEGESMLTRHGKPLPYVPYAYQHPDYWHTVQAETKGSGNMIATSKVFIDTEKAAPPWVLDAARIPIENIRGRLLLIGCEDDCLWPTARYIRRMDERLKSRAHDCRYDVMVYRYGTHFSFPESMLGLILPIFPDFIIGRAFLSSRKHPKECRTTREEIDRRTKQALNEWTKGAAK